MSGTESQTSSPISREPARSQRFGTCLQIVLPFLLAFAVVVIIVGVALALDARQAMLIADWMITILVLCPAVICLTLMLILLIASMWAMDWLNRGTISRMQRAEEFVANGHEKFVTVTGIMKQYIMKAQEKIEPVMRHMRFFDSPEKDNGQQEFAGIDKTDQGERDESGTETDKRPE